MTMSVFHDKVSSEKNMFYWLGRYEHDFSIGTYSPRDVAKSAWLEEFLEGMKISANPDEA